MPRALAEAAAPPILASEVAGAWPVADSAACVVTAADMLVVLMPRLWCDEIREPIRCYWCTIRSYGWSVAAK